MWKILDQQDDGRQKRDKKPLNRNISHLLENDSAIINIERVRLSVRRAEKYTISLGNTVSFSEHKGSSVFLRFWCGGGSGTTPAMSSWFWSSSGDQSGSESSSVSKQMGSLSCPRPTCVAISFTIFSSWNRLSWFISASSVSWPTWATWRTSWLFELEPGLSPLGLSLWRAKSSKNTFDSL